MCLVTASFWLQWTQATGLDARVSRVKWPAQFTSHWYGISFTEYVFECHCLSYNYGQIPPHFVILDNNNEDDNDDNNDDGINDDNDSNNNDNNNNDDYDNKNNNNDDDYSHNNDANNDNNENNNDKNGSDSMPVTVCLA